MLPGDVLLVASSISYLGCFTKQYRLELFERKWIPYLKKLPKPIPLSMGYVGANVLSLLTDDALIATWNNEGRGQDNLLGISQRLLPQFDDFLRTFLYEKFLFSWLIYFRF